MSSSFDGSSFDGSSFDILCKIASGGAGSVYVARRVGARRDDLVALKRPHSHLLEIAAFRASLLAEAKIASRIRHPNVVSVVDVAVEGEAIDLVMNFIEGASLVQLNAAPVPVRIAGRILIDACLGLHAAHELTDDAGRPLALVHRDVSPHNLLVGVDGLCRVTDFGIAKCLAENSAETTQGVIKGKIAYVAPEQARGEPLDRRVDLFALGVVAWELLTGQRLFRGTSDADTVHRVLYLEPPPPSSLQPNIPRALDAVIERVLSKAKSERPDTAEQFAAEWLAACGGRIASHEEVAAWLWERAGADIERRRALIARSDQDEPTGRITEVPPPVVATTNTPTAPAEPRFRRRLWPAAGALGIVLIGVVGVFARSTGNEVGASSTPSGAPEQRTVPMAATSALPSATVDVPSAEPTIVASPPALTASTSSRTRSPSTRHHATPPTPRAEAVPAPHFKAAPNPYR